MFIATLWANERGRKSNLFVYFAIYSSSICIWWMISASLPVIAFVLLLLISTSRWLRSFVRPLFGNKSSSAPRQVLPALVFSPLRVSVAPVHRRSSGTWDSCLTPVTCRDTPDGCTLWKLTPGLCKSKLNCEVKRLGPVTSSSRAGRGRGAQADQRAELASSQTHTHTSTHAYSRRHTHINARILTQTRTQRDAATSRCLFLTRMFVYLCASSACVHELNYNLVISAVSHTHTNTDTCMHRPLVPPAVTAARIWLIYKEKKNNLKPSNEAALWRTAA